MILCYTKNISAEEISENILSVLRSTFQFSVESVPGCIGFALICSIIGPENWTTLSAHLM